MSVVRFITALITRNKKLVVYRFDCLLVLKTVNSIGSFATRIGSLVCIRKFAKSNSEKYKRGNIKKCLYNISSIFPTKMQHNMQRGHKCAPHWNLVEFKTPTKVKNFKFIRTTDSNSDCSHSLHCVLYLSRHAVRSNYTDLTQNSPMILHQWGFFQLNIPRV